MVVLLEKIGNWRKTKILRISPCLQSPTFSKSPHYSSFALAYDFAQGPWGLLKKPPIVSEAKDEERAHSRKCLSFENLVTWLQAFLVGFEGFRCGRSELYTKVGNRNFRSILRKNFKKCSKDLRIFHFGPFLGTPRGRRCYMRTPFFPLRLTNVLVL